MEYTVGSIADLVSGSVTLNKPKVIAKKFETLTKTPTNPTNLNTIKSEETPQTVSKGKNKRKKERRSLNTEQNSVLKEKNKSTKRRLDSTVEDQKPPEKKAKVVDETQQRLTVFVGNLPLSTTTAALKKYFSSCGKIESVRIRSVPVANPNTPKRVAVIKQEFHPNRKSFNGYICFKSEDDVAKAIELNGSVFEGHHIRVSSAQDKLDTDENKAVFVGNLRYDSEDEDLWQLFEQFGPISSVRIVRDNKTGIGKGFGYVNFQSSDSVELALQMENILLKGKPLRVFYCSKKVAKSVKKLKGKKVNELKPLKVKKEKNTENRGQNSQKVNESKPLKVKDETNTADSSKDSKSYHVAKSVKKLKSQKINESKPLKVKEEKNTTANIKDKKSFQGFKLKNKKKKKKINKDLLKKKKIMKKLTAPFKQ